MRTGPTANEEYVWTVTFTSMLGNSSCPSVPCLTTAHTLGGTGAAVATVVTRPGREPSFGTTQTQVMDAVVYERQTITTTGSPTAGTFTVNFNGAAAAITCNYDITAEDLKFRLETLATVGIVDVSRTPTADGLLFTIDFTTNLGDVPLLVVGDNLTPASAGVSAVQVNKGVAPALSTVLSGLSASDEYAVRISAGNAAGYGSSTASFQNAHWASRDYGACPATGCPAVPHLYSGVTPLSEKVQRAPGAPGSSALSVISDSQLELSFVPPTSNGSPILGYKVEYFTAAGTSETQEISLKNSADDTAGTFTLTFNSQTTSRIAYNASATEVKDALERLASITLVDVSRDNQPSGANPYGFIWTVTFSQDVGNVGAISGSASLITGTAASLTFPTTNDGAAPTNYKSYELSVESTCGGTYDSTVMGPCAAGNDATQTIETSAAATITGTFAVSFRGQRTAAIPASATAAQMHAALEQLSTIPSLVTVSRNASSSNGFTWVVTFPSSMGAVDDFVLDGGLLAGTDASIDLYKTVVVYKTAQKHDISGTWVIHLGTEVTGSLAFGCSAADVKTALELLNSVGRVEVTKRIGFNPTEEWHILFKVVTADLDTLRAVPTFKGTGVLLSTKRPGGVKPYHYTIGNAAEIKTMSLRANTAVTAGSINVKVGSSGDACVPWGTTAANLKTLLEGLGAGFVDKVSVTRSGDGTSASQFGYTYTIAFWGTLTTNNVATMSTNGVCATFTGGDDKEILFDTVLEGTANAAFNQNYVALAENQQYFVRVSARNAMGYGPASTLVSATTSYIANVPGQPTSVTIGERYSGSSMSMFYNAPHSDGGAPISKYKLEWDSQTSFDSGNYRFSDIEVRSEVQKVVTSFQSTTGRNGTFTLSWGGLSTPNLAWDVSAEAMASALRVVTGGYNKGSNPIVVSRTGLGNGYEWRVTFTGNRGDLAEMEANYDLMGGLRRD